ncbi:MAG: sugar phosphate isomerase/epimerase family protein [Planctomycetota bacterium]
MKGEGKLGLMAGVGKRTDLVEKFRTIQAFGIETCQLLVMCEAVDEVFAPDKVKAACAETGMEITAITAGYGNQAYDTKDGPATLGLVPPAVREERVGLLKNFSDAIALTGIENIVLHIGFIPDDERDPIYVSFIEMMQDTCTYLKENGQNALCETGSELASTLLRTIHDVGTGNLFVNFDTANVILYGKSNPLDAAELFGEYVRATHLKDGMWPNRDETLGIGTEFGDGAVPFELVIRKLKAKGFNGPWTIEYEAGGPADEGVRKAVDLIRPLI